MPPRKDKQPINLSGNEVNEPSQNFGGRLDDLSKRVEKGFQMISDMLVEVLLRVLQPLIENMHSNYNPDIRNRGVIEGTYAPGTSQGLRGQDRPPKYPTEPRSIDISVSPLRGLIVAQTEGLTQRA